MTDLICCFNMMIRFNMSVQMGLFLMPDVERRKPFLCKYEASKSADRLIKQFNFTFTRIISIFLHFVYRT